MVGYRLQVWYCDKDKHEMKAVENRSMASLISDLHAELW